MNRPLRQGFETLHTATESLEQASAAMVMYLESGGTDLVEIHGMCTRLHTMHARLGASYRTLEKAAGLEPALNG